MKTPLKILIVDDSDDDTRLLLRALAKGGFEIEYRRVDAAQTLSQALDGSAWDAVIVDYYLPGFGGIAAIEIIRESGLDIPIILVSGKIGEETAVEEMKAGAHDCVMKDKLARLGPAVKRELADAENRRQQRAGVNRIQQLNLVLRAIRNINQLIVTEKNRDKLLKGACDSLIETRGYHSAWIVLLKDGKLVTHAKAGVRGGFDKVLKRLELNAPVRCVEQALQSKDVVSTPQVQAECGDCPMVQAYPRLGALSCRLEHAEQVFGVLVVSVDPERAVHPEEISLFHEVSHDIGLALHALEQELQRLHAEGELRKSEARLRTVVDSTIDALVAIGQDGRILFFNPAAERMFGVSAADALHQPLDFLMPETYRAVHRANVASYFATGEPGSAIGNAVEFTGLRSDGTEFPIEASLSRGERGAELIVLAVIRDITERKRAEERMRRLSQMLDLAPGSITVHDLAGHFIYANQRALEIHGYTREEFMQLNLHDLNVPESARLIPERLRELMEKGQAVFEVMHYCKDGSIVPQEVSARSALWDGQQVILSVATDLTERKQAAETLLQSHQDLIEAHEQLKAQQQQLIRSEKMASLGQLAAGVAHEINNPIAFIKSNLGSLQHYVSVFKALIEANRALAAAAESGDEAGLAAARERIAQLEAKEDVAYILQDIDGMIQESRGGVERVRDIVSDLRNFAHAGKETPVDVDVNQIIESSLRIAGSELKYKCEVVQDLRPLPLLRCYPERLNQVFVNLLVNAAQAIAEQGQIEVTTHATDENIIIRISDTGQGIAPENISKIFDPFFTTKEVGQGTGLGLAISDTTVRNHGGTIEVQSNLQQGTTFTISLPLRGVPDA